MKNSSPIRFLLLLGAIALAGVTTALAEETASTIKFSDATKPGTLKVVLSHGDIWISGADTPEIVVKSEAQQEHRPRKDGLRVLTESASFSLTEKDNVVTLDAGPNGWMGSEADFKITVPRGTNVVITNSLGGDITCGGITGDIEIKSLHGEVKLNDITGGAVVDTMNGEITASIRELHQGKALSFTSMNGEVELLVPGSAKANIRLRTQNGTILTDFDEKTLVTKVENVAGAARHEHGKLTAEMRQALREAARASKVAGEQFAAAMRETAEAVRQGVNDENEEKGDVVPPVPPVPPTAPMLPAIPNVLGGKLVTGTLNGGGAEINVITMNGDVKLRHSDGK
jgi:hypothetical protein